MTSKVHIPPKVQEHITLAFKLVTDKFVLGQLAAFYNAVLIMGVGGTLYVLRAITDDYSAIDINFIHITLLGILYLACCGLLAAIFYKLRVQNKLKSKESLVLVVCVFELLLICNITVRTFQYIPRDHYTEVDAQLRQLLTAMNLHMPIRINDFVTVTHVSLDNKTITFTSNIEEKEGYYWDEKAMRATLLGGACPYFNQYSQYGNVQSILHNLSSDHQKFTISFVKNDCSSSSNTTPSASQ